MNDVVKLKFKGTFGRNGDIEENETQNLSSTLLLFLYVYTLLILINMLTLLMVHHCQIFFSHHIIIVTKSEIDLDLKARLFRSTVLLQCIDEMKDYLWYDGLQRAESMQAIFQDEPVDMSLFIFTTLCVPFCIEGIYVQDFFRRMIRQKYPWLQSHCRAWYSFLWWTIWIAILFLLPCFVRFFFFCKKMFH